jgi:hypothetical protein
MLSYKHKNVFDRLVLLCCHSTICTIKQLPPTETRSNVDKGRKSSGIRYTLLPPHPINPTVPTTTTLSIVRYKNTVEISLDFSVVVV